MSSQSLHLDRLAAVVNDRMEELQLNNDTIGRLADGPSTTSISKIRNAKLVTISDQTYRKLDKSLRWRPGSARHVAMFGGDPVEMPLPWDMPSVISEVEHSDLSAATREAILRLLGEAG